MNPIMGESAILLRKRDKGVILAGALLAIAILGVADTFTGPHLSFADFYILIVAFSAWWLGRKPAYALAVLSSAVEAFSNILAGKGDPHWGVTAWNVAAELLVFALVAELIARIHILLEHEKCMARSDLLTRLANRRWFDEATSVELERLRRYNRPFTVALMDLDRFKEINDTQGHKTGDRVLRAVGDVLRAQVRKTDLPARIGGDEFAVLFPETDEKGARQMVPEIHRRLVRAMKEQNWPVTASIGAVTFHRAPKAPEQVLVEADKRMYQVKNAGRNGVAFGRH